jgi:hypothetical protein
MPANKVLGAYRWCRWTEWINNCKADSNYYVTLTIADRPATFNVNGFRMMASQKGNEADAWSHVNIDWKTGIIKLQFCWCDNRHQGLCANTDEE